MKPGGLAAPMLLDMLKVARIQESEKSVVPGGALVLRLPLLPQPIEVLRHPWLRCKDLGLAS